MRVEERDRKVAKMGDQMIGKIKREFQTRKVDVYLAASAEAGAGPEGKKKWLNRHVKYKQQWEKQGWVLEQIRRSRIPEKSESEKVGGEQCSFTFTWRRQRRKRESKTVLNNYRIKLDN